MFGNEKTVHSTSCIIPERLDKDVLVKHKLESVERALLNLISGQDRLEKGMNTEFASLVKLIDSKFTTKSGNSADTVDVHDIRPEFDKKVFHSSSTSSKVWFHESEEKNTQENGMSKQDSTPERKMTKSDSTPEQKMSRTSTTSSASSSPPHEGGKSSPGRNTLMKAKRIPDLEQIILADEADEKERQTTAREMWERKHSSNVSDRLFLYKIKGMDTLVDIMMAVVIVTNCIFLGVQLDAVRTGGWDGWRIGEIIFSALFWLELGIRLYRHGWHHFCGHGWLSHVFDAGIIAVDTLQLVIDIFFDRSNSVPSASLFRMVRLARITRLLRMVPTSMFKDLLAMVQGLSIGMMTLQWAILVFFLLVYVMSLLCRDVFGDEEKHNFVYEYFNSVPRSMLTVFRCSFGDCSSLGGTPIAEHITHHFGGMFGFMYCLFTFFMTVGFFNVISAIFVDSTMSAAAAIEKRTMQARLEDKQRWCRNVAIIIKRIVALSPDHHMEGVKLSSCVDSLLGHPIQTSYLEEAVLDSEAVFALNELDIDPDDHTKLVDILDPDHNGSVGVLEIVNGLSRLRGQPRRSDIVTVDLMVRSLQETTDEVLEQLDEIKRSPALQRRQYEV